MMTRDELVEKMLDARRAKLDSFGHIWIAHPYATEGMSAALDVVKDELLGPTDYDQLRSYGHSSCSEEIDTINFVLASRRAQLDKVKTPEERVDIIRPYLELRETFWKVRVDGVWKANLQTFPDAEIYRLGLIAKLKEESKS